MSRARKKRYLGMTVPQWLVLGVLGLLICCTVVGGFWWLNSMVTSAYTVPNLPVVDVTPLPTSTPLPTETIVPTPSATPISYESLIPAGWKLFPSDAAPGMETWLPSSYVPQTEQDKKTAIPILPGTEDEALRTVLLLKDTTPSPYLILTTLEVVTRPVLGGTLDQMIDDQFGVLMRTSHLLERDIFDFQTNANPARRLIFDVNTNGVEVGLAIYVVQVGNNLYYLGFATPFNELYTRLPGFDQIAQTFRFVPVIPTPTLTPVPTNTPLSH